MAVTDLLGCFMKGCKLPTPDESDKGEEDDDDSHHDYYL